MFAGSAVIEKNGGRGVSLTAFCRDRKWEISFSTDPDSHSTAYNLTSFMALLIARTYMILEKESIELGQLLFSLANDTLYPMRKNEEGVLMMPCGEKVYCLYLLLKGLRYKGANPRLNYTRIEIERGDIRSKAVIDSDVISGEELETCPGRPIENCSALLDVRCEKPVSEMINIWSKRFSSWKLIEASKAVDMTGELGDGAFLSEAVCRSADALLFLLPEESGMAARNVFAALGRCLMRSEIVRRISIPAYYLHAVEEISGLVGETRNVKNETNVVIGPWYKPVVVISDKGIPVPLYPHGSGECHFCGVTGPRYPFSVPGGLCRRCLKRAMETLGYKI